MSYSITVNLIPGLPQNPYRHGVGNYEGVVAHSTANPEATAAGNRNYESTHWNDAFVHFFVDWTEIIQTADTNYLSWNCGPQGNSRFVGVELCETADPAKFQESYKRYTWLLAKILHDKGLGVKRQSTLWTHHDVSSILGGSDHTDPDNYLATHGVTINQLVADVTAQYDAMSGNTAPAPKPAPVPVPAPDKKYPIPTGILKEGSTGEAVKELQTALNAVHFNCGTPDGSYGPKTMDAVKRFQSVYANPADGIYGPKTAAALDKEVNGNVKVDAVAPKPVAPKPAPVAPKPAPSELYTVRKSFADVASQIGAYANLDGAKKVADVHAGYKVFDSTGKIAYEPAPKPAPVVEKPAPVVAPAPKPVVEKPAPAPAPVKEVPAVKPAPTPAPAPKPEPIPAPVVPQPAPVEKPQAPVEVAPNPNEKVNGGLVNRVLQAILNFLKGLVGKKN